MKRFLCAEIIHTEVFVMSLIGYDLSQYPLEDHYRVCRQYMNHSMD